MNAWATELRCAEPRFPLPKPKRKSDSRWVKCEGSLIPPAPGTCSRRAPAGPLTATVLQPGRYGAAHSGIDAPRETAVLP